MLFTSVDVWWRTKILYIFLYYYINVMTHVRVTVSLHYTRVETPGFQCKQRSGKFIFITIMSWLRFYPGETVFFCCLDFVFTLVVHFFIWLEDKITKKIKEPLDVRIRLDEQDEFNWQVQDHSRIPFRLFEKHVSLTLQNMAHHQKISEWILDPTLVWFRDPWTSSPSILGGG